MNWLTHLFAHRGDDLDDEEIETKRRQSERVKEQAEKVHRDVVIPMARQADRSITVNHYADVLAKAYKLRRGEHS